MTRLYRARQARKSSNLDSLVTIMLKQCRLKKALTLSWEFLMVLARVHHRFHHPLLVLLSKVWASPYVQSRLTALDELFLSPAAPKPATQISLRKLQISEKSMQSEMPGKEPSCNASLNFHRSTLTSIK